MKIRNGFVSNSSSSSFVVLLPEDVEKERPVDDLTPYANQLIEQGELWREEIDDGDAYDRLVESLTRYVVATLHGGPDEERIVVANNEKVRAIINEG